ncbi:hypothetical protein B0H13DRAFT_2333503 [Mycena leptocephala]|nr:hypothetical protein B0H13DRAFT_2333503 [Mycena leptocephala]
MSSRRGLDCSLDSRHPPLSPAALLAPVARPHDIRARILAGGVAEYCSTPITRNSSSAMGLHLASHCLLACIITLQVLSSRWPHPRPESCLRSTSSPYIHVTKSTPSLPSLHPFPDQSVPYNPPYCDSRSSAPRAVHARVSRAPTTCVAVSRRTRALLIPGVYRLRLAASTFPPSAGFPFATLRCPLGTISTIPSLDSNASCDKLIRCNYTDTSVSIT